MLAAARQLILPSGFVTTINGESLPERPPIHSFEATLPTVIADADGYLRRSARKTTVTVHEVHDGEVPSIYEMGIPVVALDGGERHHWNVQQKIPLTSDRDNVTPSFLQTLRVLIANEFRSRLTEEDAKAAWVTKALEDERVDSKTVETVITHRYGDKRVIADPSDAEGTKLAMSKGYTVIPGGALSKRAWENVKRSGSALPAGKVTPSPRLLVQTALGDSDALPEEKLSAPMRQVRAFSIALAQALISRLVSVEFVVPRSLAVSNKFVAAYGNGQLLFNVRALGYDWFSRELTDGILDTLLHELAHDSADDHLSSEYHDELTRIAERAVRVALATPSVFSRDSY